MAISNDALIILLPLYVLDAGFGPAFAAFVIGLRGLGLLGSDIPAGLLIARYGERAVLLIGLAATCSGFVLLAASESRIIVCIAAVLFGAGFAARMLGLVSYVSAVCEPAETGRGIAVMAGVQRGGALLGPIVGGLIARYAGYESAFLTCAALGIAAGIVIYIYADRPEHRVSREVHHAGTLSVIRDHRRVFATAGTAAMTLQLMRGTRQLLVPLFGQAIGLDVAFVGAIYSASAAIDMCLFYPIGVLVDRRGRRWSAIPAMVLFAIGLALLPLADDALTLAAIALLLGFANGCGTGIVMIMGADLSRRAANRSGFLGVWRVIGDAGSSGAPLLTGAIISLSSLAAASVVVSALGFVGAAIMIWLVAETHQIQR